MGRVWFSRTRPAHPFGGRMRGQSPDRALVANSGTGTIRFRASRRPVGRIMTAIHRVFAEHNEAREGRCEIVRVAYPLLTRTRATTIGVR